MNRSMGSLPNSLVPNHIFSVPVACLVTVVGESVCVYACVCDLCTKRPSMLTQGIKHTEKSISQGGLVRNCRAGGESKPDGLRSRITFTDQSEGERSRRVD